MQRQAIISVRLVIDEYDTLLDAEEIVADALTEAELMAHVEGQKIVTLADGNLTIKKKSN